MKYPYWLKQIFHWLSYTLKTLYYKHIKYESIISTITLI